jgi:hypothetical protein
MPAVPIGCPSALCAFEANRPTPVAGVAVSRSILADILVLIARSRVRARCPKKEIAAGRFVDRPGRSASRGARARWRPEHVGLELAVHRVGPISAGGVGRAASRERSCRGSAGGRTEWLAILADLKAAGSYERFGGVPGLRRTPPARPGVTKTM